jgi:hypothetical protein
VRGAAGGSFSNRPPSISPSAILSRRRYQNITSAPYGEHWRAMRHNLTSEFLHPARLHRYADARRCAVRGLVEDLAEQRRVSGVVHAAESIRYAMFGLVATMCFGEGLDRGRVRAMADAQRDLVKSLAAARLFAHAKLPAVTRLIYRKQWKKLASLRQKQEETYLPESHFWRCRCLAVLDRPVIHFVIRVDTSANCCIGNRYKQYLAFVVILWVQYRI